MYNLKKIIFNFTRFIFQNIFKNKANSWSFVCYLFGCVLERARAFGLCRETTCMCAWKSRVMCDSFCELKNNTMLLFETKLEDIKLITDIKLTCNFIWLLKQFYGKCILRNWTIICNFALILRSQISLLKCIFKAKYIHFPTLAGSFVYVFSKVKVFYWIFNKYFLIN